MKKFKFIIFNLIFILILSSSFVFSHSGEDIEDYKRLFSILQMRAISDNEYSFTRSDLKSKWLLLDSSTMGIRLYNSLVDTNFGIEDLIIVPVVYYAGFTNPVTSNGYVSYTDQINSIKSSTVNILIFTKKEDSLISFAPYRIGNSGSSAVTHEYACSYYVKNYSSAYVLTCSNLNSLSSYNCSSISSAYSGVAAVISSEDSQLVSHSYNFTSYAFTHNDQVQGYFLPIFVFSNYNLPQHIKTCSLETKYTSGNGILYLFRNVTTYDDFALLGISSVDITLNDSQVMNSLYPGYYNNKQTYFLNHMEELDYIYNEATLPDVPEEPEVPEEPLVNSTIYSGIDKYYLDGSNGYDEEYYGFPFRVLNNNKDLPLYWLCEDDWERHYLYKTDSTFVTNSSDEYWQINFLDYYPNPSIGQKRLLLFQDDVFVDSFTFHVLGGRYTSGDLVRPAISSDDFKVAYATIGEDDPSKIVYNIDWLVTDYNKDFIWYFSTDNVNFFNARLDWEYKSNIFGSSRYYRRQVRNSKGNPQMNFYFKYYNPINNTYSDTFNLYINYNSTYGSDLIGEFQPSGDSPGVVNPGNPSGDSSYVPPVFNPNGSHTFNNPNNYNNLNGFDFTDTNSALSSAWNLVPMTFSMFSSFFSLIQSLWIFVPAVIMNIIICLILIKAAIALISFLKS